MNKFFKIFEYCDVNNVSAYLLASIFVIIFLTSIIFVACLLVLVPCFLLGIGGVLQTERVKCCKRVYLGWIEKQFPEIL